jgi:hypothetical protein
MRAYLNLIEGTVSAEVPFRPGEYQKAVKGLSGERIELQYLREGAGVLLPANTQIKISVRDRPGGTLLAEQTAFTAPTAADGFYTARLSFNTDPVLALLAANPTKNSFAAVGEFAWLVPGATDWEVSDNLNFILLRRVGAGGDPVALVSPYAWLKDTLVAGTNATLTYDDEAQTITVSISAASVPPFYLDRATADGAFMIVKNAAGTDVFKVPTYDLGV